MNADDLTTLTTFNFDVPEGDDSEEWGLYQVFNKFKAAVSGQTPASTCTHSDEELRSTESMAGSEQRHIFVTTPTPPASCKSSTCTIGLPTQSSIRAPTSTAVTTVTASAVHEDDISRQQQQQQQQQDEGDEYLGQPISKTASIDSDTHSVSTTFSISTSHSLSRIIARLRGQKSDKEFWMSDEQCKECYKCRKPFKLLRRRHHCRICGQIFCGKCASHTISGQLYNQKGEVRVCNFCFREHHMGRDASGETAVRNIDPLPEHQLLPHNASESVTIIPSQPPPSAPPKMHIPTPTVKHPSSLGQQYGDSDATTVQLEITTDASSLHDHPRPSFQTSNTTTTTIGGGGTLSRSGSISASAPGGMSDMDIEQNGDGSLRRLLDASASLLKSSRPRSNTSSSVAVEDPRHVNSNHGSPLPFQSNSLHDRGGGMLVADRELSPFMSHGMTDEEEEDDMEYQLYDLYSRPASHPGGASYRMPSSGSNQSQPVTINKFDSATSVNMHDTVDSDDEAYDNRLRLKRTEELRGVGPERSLSLRRQSIGSHRSGSRSVAQHRHKGIRINTSNLPKADYALLQSEGWSPAPFMSPFDDKYSNTPFDHTAIKSRLFTPRSRRISAPPPNVELSYGALLHARRMLRQLMADASFSSLSDQMKSDWEGIITNLLLKVTDNVRPDVRSGDDMDIRHYIKIKKVPGGLPSDSFYVKGVMFTKNVAHKRMVRNISQPRILILLFSLDYSRVEMENQLMSIDPVITQEREHIRKLVNRIVALRPSLLLVKSTVSRVALEYLLEANIPVIHNVKYSVIEAVARCTHATIVTSVDKLQLGSLSLGHCGTFEIRTLIHEWIPNRRKTYLIFDECQPDLGGTIVLRGATNETLRLIKRLIDFMVFVVNNLKLETSLLRDSFAKNRSLDQQDSKNNNDSVISPDTESEEKNATLSSASIQDMDTSINKFIHLYQDTVLSASQFVVFPKPYLLTCLKETNDKLAALEASAAASTSPSGKAERQSVSSNADHQPHPSFDGEYEHLIARRNQLARTWAAYVRESIDHINPFYHQNIMVLYSNVCTITTVPCQGPEIRIFEYYCPPADKTLGQYISDLCRDALEPCPSSMCEHPVHHHYKSYAHGNARINVMIESFQCPQSGMSDKILMWSYCKECEQPTPVTPMSENTWNYSFGKFLEICLYQRGVQCRADICPHDIGLHHVRYFGYKDFAVRFQYERIDLLEVAPPPMKLFTLSKVQIDLKENEFKTLRSKISRFYQSIIERNKSFPFDLVDPRKLEACKAELQEISHRSDSEKKKVLQILQSVYARTDPTDALTINWVRRILFEQITNWDLEYADFVRHYLQPERELRKITASHLRKVFPTDMPEETTGGERTKRAAEMTDLPLLGTELDDDDDDSYNLEEQQQRQQPPSMLPRLSCSPIASENVDGWQEGIDDGQEDQRNQSKDNKRVLLDEHPSFLQHEVRRRLSLELMREFSAKFKQEESSPREKGVWHPKPKGNQNTSNMASGVNNTPSRIPVLHLGHQNKAKLSPPLYDTTVSPSAVYDGTRPSVQMQPAEQPNQLESMRRRKSMLPDCRYDLLLTSDNSASGSGQLFAGAKSPFGNPKHAFQHIRSNTFTGSRNNDDTSSAKNDPKRAFAPPASHGRQFRSRLPRKKTSLQVYTRVNDLVRENMEDELPDEERMNVMNQVIDENQPSGDSVDYFSPMAPYTNRVTEAPRTSFFSQHYQGTTEPITDFGMELERHPPPAVELLEPPPVSVMAGVSSNDIRHHDEDDNESLQSENRQMLEDKARDDKSQQPEKSSIMKTITSFLTDSGVASLPPLEYPLQPTEHIFPDSFVIVNEEKPSTIIAYTLSCHDYLAKLYGAQDSASEFSVDDSIVNGSTDLPMPTESSIESSPMPASDIQETLTRESGSHMGYSFRTGTGTTKFVCKVFFVEQFDALRRNCGCHESYIHSLADCVKWDSSGGRSGSAFLKTADDRLLMKQVSRFELDAFLRFAPAYFHYMSEAFFSELPTVLAKIFGFYSISYKNTATGKSMRMDVLVMENLFYQRKIKQIFDLKGSMRNRHVQSTGKQDEVLLDENLVELIYHSPLFIRAHAKELLRSSLHNDTLFLSNRNVMDYSLLVGIDDERQELVVGIVDFIRTFTWDKKLESWVKESGILGGGGKGPTIVSPRQYRIRFREAMERYFLMVPDEWSLTRQIRAPYTGLYHHHQQQLVLDQPMNQSSLQQEQHQQE
ncbi:hypothetical protein LRAMOSA10238 [Lichtheimia ramosa]|uniref:1-phosphatidylinositol-3-phosphate 5-kinase n=1 Tax=Lichtheimia ramosa TaxID=688394 RepID=A0A077WQ76_9FUNG|nr:hypothetical protein LRAMOSA10238 [Lichtheimia ramosa]